MGNTEKQISRGDDLAIREVHAVSELSDDEVETVFEELVARIDAERQPPRTETS
ncbi:hypothetical protein RM190_20195 [Paracoccus sp. CPCC 101403]|uniref:Uncharacterized protein n=1 Tax=Paracoccus broussonetiae TaxID=3075834 RepID=A0ABU3EJ99_9RHOB|nr:hypothetical protein [Paracoccus sp. CPCC 101403]